MNLDYRNLLIEEFEARKRRNPQYSLRSYASSLGMPVSRLSEVLRGKSGVSIKRAKELSFRLFAEEEHQALFMTLVEVEHSKSKLIRDKAKVRLDKIMRKNQTNLSFERFAVIKDWYHYSLLELTELSDFQSCPKWMAKKLGITENQVAQAIERLEKLDLIKNVDGKWQQVHKEMGTTGGVSSLAVREHHKQIIEKVRDKIDKTPLEKRFLNSTTMAIDENKIQEAKKALKEFRDKFCVDIQTSDEKNQVYVLALQFFPLLEDDNEN